MRCSSKWKGIFIRVISPAVLIATLKDAVARLHAEASHMSEAEQIPARQQADAIDEAAEDIKTGMMEMHNHGSYTDQRSASGSSSIVQMESNKLLPWLMLTCLLSGLAIAMSWHAIDKATIAERETKLAREDLRVQAIALARHGVNTDEHAVEKGND